MECVWSVLSNAITIWRSIATQVLSESGYGATAAAWGGVEGAFHAPTCTSFLDVVSEIEEKRIRNYLPHQPHHRHKRELRTNATKLADDSSRSAGKASPTDSNSQSRIPPGMNNKSHDASSIINEQQHVKLE